MDTPLADIATAMTTKKKKVKMSISTKKDFQRTGNYIYDLDKNLQSILEQIIKQQNDYADMNRGTDRVFMKIKFQELDTCLELKRLIPVGELKQFKTQFFKINKLNAFTDFKEASLAFISYIQSYEEDF